MKYEQMCKEILSLVGGRENITDCYNCMTRLRLMLADVSKVDIEALKKVEGAMGINVVGSQVQVIIGPQAGAVCKEFCKVAGIERKSEIQDEESAKEDAQLSEKKPMNIKNILNKVVDTIGNCIQPLLPIIVCGGMFKMLCSVLGPSMFNLISESSNLYKLFYMVGDAPFYFLPIMLGYTGAKHFKISIPLGMMMGAIMLHPTLTGIVQAGKSFDVYGIPMKLVDYSSSIVPMILCLWIMSYVSKFFQKIIPDMLNMMLAHLCTMLVMLPLALCVLAPAGTVIGNTIANALLALPNYIGPFGVAIVCLVWPLLVIVGIHMPIGMMALTTFFAVGHEDVIFIADSLQHFTIMGVALAFAIMAKNNKQRSLGLTSFTSIFLGGVVEPTLFGIAVPHKKFLLSLMLGNCIGGLFAAVFGVGIYAMGTSNILNIISFTGGTSHNFVFGILSCVVSFAGGLLISLFVNKVDFKKKAVKTN